jgi:cysteine desulfurase
VPAVVGFAAAVRAAVTDLHRRGTALAALRDSLVDAIRRVVPDAVLNGDPGLSSVATGPSRLPGNAHLTFPGCEGDSLLMLLDANGIECSTGSACTAGVAQPSHVLLAMGADPTAARGSLRFSLGHTTTEADVAAVGSVIGGVVERARNAGLAGARRSARAAAARQVEV